ncbi:MAG: tetratricopeptide repeat protein [Candidatus Marinimicrobia bacterium]|nr:tetratricopeptide repeat protein [Candidatus Neomarinimicrobiota bacterium]
MKTLLVRKGKSKFVMGIKPFFTKKVYVMERFLSLLLSIILGCGAMASTLKAQTTVERELRRLNAKIEREKVRTDSLETQIRILLPELKNALEATVHAKKQTDSIAILLVNRINTLHNKIRILEDKAEYTDSTNFEILSQLVMIENKIITLTNSFTEMYNLKKEDLYTVKNAKLSAIEYKKLYLEYLGYYQNSDYNKAIKGFADLVLTNPTHDLADNCQYWLAECYYASKNFKRSIIEFEKVFSFPGTDKDDDAQLKLGLAYQSMGNIEKARAEYTRLLDYFPNSEYYQRAKEALKKLSVQ